MDNLVATSLREAINPELNDNLSTEERLDKIFEWAEKHRDPLLEGDVLPEFSYRTIEEKVKNLLQHDMINFRFKIDGLRFQLTNHSGYDPSFSGGQKIQYTSLINNDISTYHINTQEMENDPKTIKNINEVYFPMKKAYSPTKSIKPTERNEDICNNYQKFTDSK